MSKAVDETNHYEVVEHSSPMSSGVCPFVQDYTWVGSIYYHELRVGIELECQISAICAESNSCQVILIVVAQKLRPQLRKIHSLVVDNEGGSAARGVCIPVCDGAIQGWPNYG